MPRWLILYKINPATQSADPKAALKETEANINAANELTKAGIFKEHGTFNPGEGFIIAEFPSTEEAFKLAQRFWPGVISDIREYIPWEKSQKMVLSNLRDQAK